MATNQAEPQHHGIVDHLFLEHPRSLGMTWWDHGTGALKIGVELIGAGSACLIHAFIPAWFTQTAGKTITGMHEHMMRRKAGAATPENWPDYEI